MNLRVPRNNLFRLCLFAFAMVTAMAAGAFAPTPALAAEGVAYVKDASGKITYYTGIVQAINAAYGEGNTLVMLQDWDFNSGAQDIQTTMGVDGGKSLTIDMNGHRISNTGDGSVIHLYKGASLTLTSSKRDTWFTFNGYSPERDPVKQSMKVCTGGLVTGGEARLGGGVYMEDDSSLTLDGITLAGNWAAATKWAWQLECGGGIYADKNCTIKLTGNASVQNNRSDQYGGGIYLNGEGASLIIDGGSVSLNCAPYGGGGVVADGSQNTIALKNGGTISGNYAKGGGGIYVNQSKFTIVSEDKTGVISNNKAVAHGNMDAKESKSGGAIHVDSKTGENRGLIKGLKFNGNWSAHDGGAIELDQESTTISECTFTGNSADKDGGAIYVDNDKCVIDGCTITDNVCAVKDSTCEGGGVFVSYRYDVKMTGVCTVKGNTRVKKDSGVADDVFLGTISGGTGYAYITGGLEKGSNVGVRTGIEGDRRIGKNISNKGSGCFFIDLDGYYVSYGSDEGGDMWQRRGTGTFALKVDGAEQGSYAKGATATATAKPAEGKFFWKWDLDATEGFHPASETITDALLYDQSISFAMPNNEVNLVGVYGDKATSGVLTFAYPNAGEDLPTTATFIRTDGGTGGSGTYTVKLSWYKIVSDAAKTPASGKAEYGVSYMAYAWVDSNQKAGLVFAEDATVNLRVGNMSDEVATVEQVTRDGSLLLTTPTYRTAPSSVTEVEPISVTVQAGTALSDFIASLPASAKGKTNAGTSVELGLKKSNYYFDGIVEGGKIVKPEGGTFEGQVALTGVAGVNLPDELAHVNVQVTVTDAEPTPPQAPTVSPDAGTYSTTTDASRFVGGKLKVTASCATAGATIKYRADYYNGSSWVKGEETTYSGAIYLEPASNDMRIWDVVLWAESDGGSSETVNKLYFINDAQTKTVTVDGLYTDVDSTATPGVASYTVQKDKALTITAPVIGGYEFEKWVVAGEERTGLTLALDKVEDDMTVTAVYNPVVSEIDIDIDAPAAHGILSQAASTVRVKAGDSDSWTDITSLLSGPRGNPAITWAPAGDEEGKAGHMANYTASLEFKKVEGTSTAKYLLDKDVTIDCKGTALPSGSAYIAEADDGTKLVCIAFPNTGAIEDTELESLSAVSLTHEEAWSYQVKQDAGESASWSLPKEVTATSKACGCSVPLTIEWDAVTGFDKTDLGAQEFTATGTVVYPSYVDHDGETETVEVTVSVAAAETVGTPRASIESGTYASTQEVELSCETADAVIRYTVDGSEPTEDSPIFGSEAIEVAHSTVLKVKAFRDGWVPSETATFTYAIAHRVTFDSAGGSAVGAQTVEDGGTAIEPKAPTREGYDFKGWTLDGEPYDFAAPVTGDLTLTASWEKADGGSDTDPDIDPEGGDDGGSDSDSDSGKGGKDDGGKKGEPSGRETLPSTGDASAFVGAVAAAGAAAVVLGTRRRRG